MPCQAKANNLMLVEQPPELKTLTPLELRLVAQRIPFMKMVGLPRGRQHGIHGPAVNVPTKVETVCDIFPRLPSQSQLLPLKFKRKRKYKTYHMYDYVKPEKVIEALKYLKENNPHYKDIQINQNWSAEAAEDDKEMWEAVTGSNTAPRHAKSQKHLSNMCYKKFSLAGEKNCNIEKNGQESATDEEVITAIGKRMNMDVIDVPRDGNYLFTAVCSQLKNLGVITLEAHEFRKQISAYMMNFPELYKDFVCDRIASEETRGADTEQPTSEDVVICNMESLDDQAEVRWVRYLDGIEDGSIWGNHIILQAIVDMFNLKVFVHATVSEHVVEVFSRYNTSHEFHLGLLDQYHYVILRGTSHDLPRTTYKEKQQQKENTVETRERAHANVRCCMNVYACEDEMSEVKVDDAAFSDASDHDDSNGDSDMDLLIEDDVAFERSSKVQGVPYKTSLLNKTSNMSDKIFSVAPGEGKKPIPLLSDKHFEELANPDKYPDGGNALTVKRLVKIPPRSFFNQRLLDCDGRFAKSIEYLLSAQYATESQQVHSNSNHFVYRRVAGKEFHGKKLNAGLVKMQKT